MCFCIRGHQGWFPMAFSPLKTLAWNSSIASFTVSRYCNLLVLCLGISRHSLWKTNGNEMRQNIHNYWGNWGGNKNHKYIYIDMCVWKLYRPLKYWGALPCWSEVKQSRHDRWKTSPSARSNGCPTIRVSQDFYPSLYTTTWPQQTQVLHAAFNMRLQVNPFHRIPFWVFYLQEVSTS